MSPFDLVVIGSGSAASSAATRCRRAGWRVGMIDERPLGGTCALRGCDPKRVLVGVAEIVDSTRRLRAAGVTDDTRVDWPALMRFKRSFTDPVPEAKERRLREAGIEIVRGHARFTGRTTIEVGNRALDARHVVIATGATPQPLRFEGAGEVITSDDFLELPVLPPRILFVGGGYISFEFGHLAARGGANVTILHRGAQPLEQFDPDLVAMLVEHTRKLGIDVRTNVEVTRIARDGASRIVTGTTNDREERFVADLVVHGAGRVPALDGLELHAAGIRHTADGVEVNDYLQSVSNPLVFAAGDAAGRGPALTPVAGRDGRVVAANLLNGNSEKVDYRGVVSIVFTMPPLAAVGLHEAEARRLGLDVETRSADMSEWYSSRRVGQPTAAYKTLVDRVTERVLGAHLLGPHASEVINLFALAIRNNLTASQMRDTLFGYPTGASDISSML
ncbi:MAG TPA: NAD(P)/FAD-dependent oxidoreductase [Vicinamibacterales bacterium]|nr:NAD(P)/FAD-dependent oxidoreductase [Vicinamibacterales bacterium]